VSFIVVIIIIVVIVIIQASYLLLPLIKPQAATPFSLNPMWTETDFYPCCSTVCN